MKLVDWLGLDSVLLYNCNDEGYGDGTALGKNFTDSAYASLMKRQFDWIVPFRTPQEAIKRLNVLKSMKVQITSLGISDHGAPAYEEFGPHGTNFKDSARHIGKLVEPKGDICLYGCQVAKGKAGSDYLKQISDLSGKTVSGYTGLNYHSESGITPAFLSSKKQCSQK